MATRVTVDDQIRYADDHGLTVSRRQLERYRYEGLMPRPRRTEYCGRRGVPTYPSRSCEQLVFLMRLDGSTSGPARAVALAMAGFSIEPHVLLDAVAAELRRMEAGMWQVAERCAVERGTTPVQALAERLGRARPRGVKIPRARGQLEVSRIAAIRFVLEAFMVGGSSHRTPGDSEIEAERLVGLDRARRDVLAPFPKPWLVGTWAADFAEVGSLPALRRAVDLADRAEVEEAIRLARLFSRLLPLAAMAVGAQTKRSNRGGLAWLHRYRLEQGFAQAMWVAFMVSVVRSPLRSNALAVASALIPYEEIEEGIGQLLAMPTEERESALQRLPPKERAQLQRLLTAAHERREHAAIS
jgi:hypothetical protein